MMVTVQPLTSLLLSTLLVAVLVGAYEEPRQVVNAANDSIVAQSSGDSNVLRITSNLAIAVCNWYTFRVVKTPKDSGLDAYQEAIDRQSLMISPHLSYEETQYKVDRSSKTVTLRTFLPSGDEVNAGLVVDIASETVKFVTGSDSALLSESEYSFTPTEDPSSGGDKVWDVEQTWQFQDVDEALYGGGEFQSGLVNIAGAPVQLVQFNTEAVVPFFVSSRGYGLLWDSNAWSHLNQPKGDPIINLNGTSSSANGQITKSAKFTASATGAHHFYIDLCPDFGCGSGHSVLVTVQETGSSTVDTVQSWDELTNLPDALPTKPIELEEGKEYTLTLASDLQSAQLFVVPPAATHTLQSSPANLMDYYFIYDGKSPGVDSAVRGYRHLTGAAPLYPRWAYGFWQCKEHYHNQSELLDAAAGFRENKIPVDAFVQDWHYWGDLGWGPQWDKTIYPDPEGMVKELSSENIHLMVSVWSKFDENTKFYKEMSDKGYMIGDGDTNYYDPWNPAARELFYSFSKSAHFDIGVDALWLDATEPEGFPNENHEIHLGSGNAYFNSYSLMTTDAISAGLRRDFPDAQGRRVFSLTRSSFAGQQRTGAALWSGDISGKWDSLRRQISASIGFQLSGIPYWAQDIGGFFRPDDQYHSDDYHHLLTRWFQFGVFTPIFRVHGGGTNTELWNYGKTVMNNIVDSAIRFRYRLLPYVYSGFYKVYSEHWTMQRGMAFDFARDKHVLNLNDQYMFGSAFLVAPMFTPDDARSVYLPAVEGGWVDFWDGSTVEGTSEGNATTVSRTDVDKLEIPLYLRAGSVLVLGPDGAQFTDDIPWSTLEVRIYRGADGEFTLYEDDGVSAQPFDEQNVEYSGGQPGYSTITLSWEDATSTLTIGSRSGPGFDGMIKNRSFRVVEVKAGRGVGIPTSPDFDHVVEYDGSQVEVKLAGGYTEPVITAES